MPPALQRAFDSEVRKVMRKELADVAGVYFPDLLRAHFYEPAGDDPFAPVSEVFRHELTHAWLDLRNPRRLRALTPARQLSFLTAPGFWCVEGFPTFLQEQTIDAATGAVSENAGSFALDFVAHAQTLLPWRAVVELPRAREIDGKLFEWWKSGLVKAAMDAKWTELPYARLKTYLGINMIFDPLRVFYIQSAAVCHYLYFAESGAHRQKLLDYISKFYSGEPQDSLEFERFFGLGPDELGRRIVAHARRLIGD